MRIKHVPVWALILFPPLSPPFSKIISFYPLTKASGNSTKGAAATAAEIRFKTRPLNSLQL